MFIPFYYHYFSTETAALKSILAVSAVYAPIGALVFLLGLNQNAFRSRRMTAAALAAIISATLESGQLFFPGKHPDYTNFLIAVASAYCAAVICQWIFRMAVSRARSVQCDQP